MLFTPLLVGARYRLVRLIGTGAVGAVYLAHDKLCTRDVAVKLIGKHLAGDELAVRRFKREARLCARLRHPNVVAGLDAGYDAAAERHFIVMELVDGDDAGALLGRRGRLHAEDIVEIVTQVCDALSYTHRQGIVHGDVSPANILVRRDGVVKLTDFGVARTGWTARRDERGQPVGTPRYLAPEVAEGFAASPLSDIYSLGATAHSLIVGDSPPSGGAGDTTVGLERAARCRPLLSGLCPDVPAALADVIDRAVASEPGARQPSVAVFRSDLHASLGTTRRRPRPERPAA